MLRIDLPRNRLRYDDSAKRQVPSGRGHTATVILHCLRSDLSADFLIQSQPPEYHSQQASCQQNCDCARNNATV